MTRTEIYGQPIVAAIMNQFPGAQLMAEWTEQEVQALEAASAPAGAYLESLGQSDLAQLTYEQWMTFIKTTVSGYLDAMAASSAPYAPIRSDEVPF